MAYSQSSKMDWKTLKSLYHQEQNGSVPSTEVVRILSSNTRDILDMISNDATDKHQKGWGNFCLLISLLKVVLIHAQADSDIAHEVLNILVVVNENEFLTFVITALNTKFYSKYLIF